MILNPTRAFPLDGELCGHRETIPNTPQPECPQTSMRHYWTNKRNEYMAFFTLCREEGTIANVRKHLQYAYTFFYERSSTEPNPKALGAIDILSYHKSMKNRGLSTDTRLKYIGDLGQFLEFCGNNIVKDLRQRRLLPRRRNKRKPAKSLNQILEIIESCHDLGTWQAEIIAAFVALGAFGGTRPMEVRLGLFEDMDLDSWTYFIRFPKGGEDYGEQRNTLIVGPGRPFIKRFLEIREERLSRHRLPIDSIPLIPKIKKGTVGFYSDVRIRNFKKEVQRGCKPFTIQEMRRSFAHTSLNFPGVSEGSLQTVMGQTGRETLRRYYAIVGEAKAHAEINGAWNQYCIIEAKTEDTGSKVNGPTGNRSFSWPVFYKQAFSIVLLVFNCAYFFLFFIEERRLSIAS